MELFVIWQKNEFLGSLAYFCREKYIIKGLIVKKVVNKILCTANYFG